MIRIIKLVKAKIPIPNAAVLSLVRSTRMYILPYLVERISVNTNKTADVIASNNGMSQISIFSINDNSGSLFIG